MADQFDYLTPGAGDGPAAPDGRYEGGVVKSRSADMPDGQPYKWKCPGCTTEHLSDFAKGCHVCKERLERAAMNAQPTGPVTEDTLKTRILRHPTSVHAAGSIRAGGLTAKARRTLYLALQMFAEARPAEGTLPKAETLAWARLLAEAEAQEEDAGRTP